MSVLKRYTGTGWEAIGAPAQSGTLVRTLGYAENTSLSQDVTTLADVTSLSVVVDVPASARIKITAFVQMASSNAAGDRVRLRIRESSTTLQQTALGMTINNAAEGVTAIVSLLPSTGSHTYKVSAERADGDGTITASSGATVPAFILVENIT